jgi:AcrR family transcriptional regulator
VARAAGGLRERKKRRTKETIRREAMRLFEEHGYEATTIEQIADAAEVSPSTFFNYFPTKEDVLLDDGNDRMLAALVAARPGDEPLGVAIRRALAQWMAGAFERDREMILTQGRLGLEVPAVRARIWAEMEKGQDLLRAVIAERTGRDPDEFELRVEAWVLMTAMTAASLEWVRHDGRENILDLVNRALAVVEAGAGLDARTTAEPRPGP